MLRKLYKIFIFPYTLFWLYLMFFGFGRTQYDVNIIRIVPIMSTIHFMEQGILWNHIKVLIINVLGNIVMFVPFGFLGWIFPKFENLKTLILYFLSAICIVEALQYFTRLGVFDIDDIILNSLGVWIGFLLKYVVDQKIVKN